MRERDSEGEECLERERDNEGDEVSKREMGK